ncbi:hypothetical protein [Singulisphaera sp. PoT]|uniref:hypothetical protein n=1 Tax=Singulisphaera sp. PoT TaxID=3411797 RepID=UPI003BF4BA51
MIGKVGPNGITACVDGMPGRGEVVLHEFEGESLVPRRSEVVYSVSTLPIPADRFVILLPVNDLLFAVPVGLPLGGISIVPGDEPAYDDEPAPKGDAD